MKEPQKSILAALEKLKNEQLEKITKDGESLVGKTAMIAKKIATLSAAGADRAYVGRIMTFVTGEKLTVASNDCFLGDIVVMTCNPNSHDYPLFLPTMCLAKGNAHGIKLTGIRGNLMPLSVSGAYRKATKHEIEFFYDHLSNIVKESVKYPTNMHLKSVVFTLDTEVSPYV